MSSKEKLLEKLFQQRLPRDFTRQDLQSLLSKCGCIQDEGGRGSGIRYYHMDSGRILTFDGPHPGNELYPYQIKMVRRFLSDIGEYKERH
ncbi:MAG: type II toxin-antitoxin system HicA family toxin [Lachnospiraceae bacterium]|nr:type II toxin-antitoxin system HicA family toxin [Lachnospiraceae bacterium]